MVHQTGAYQRLHDPEVHLWICFLDDPRLAGLLDDCRRLLTPDELAQTSRFHFEADRHRHLITRALLRCTLSRYMAVEPTAWRFELSDHGRPRIASVHALPVRLDFNISHTRSLVIVAVSARDGLGVDTENLAQRKNLLHLAEHCFADAEKAALNALPPSEQHARFFEHWTLKESYIKARGLGLSIPLDQFAFDLSRPGRIALSTDPVLEDDAARWAFWQWCLKEDHLVALCLPHPGGVLPRVRLWEAPPLLPGTPWEVVPSRCSHAPGL